MEELPPGTGLGTCSSFLTHQPVCIHNTFMGHTQKSCTDFPLLSTLTEILNCWGEKSGEKTPNPAGYGQGLELPPKLL